VVNILLTLAASVIILLTVSTQADRGKVYVVDCSDRSIPVYSVGPPTQQQIKLECKGE
jgi:hypothetical protein